jgi:adenylate kinase family enzyme
MQRIMIIGGPGSGKSTLARQLGDKLGLPVIHIDPMFWAPGWVQRDPAQTLVMIDAAAAQQAWVFEGNRADHYAGRAARADLIVFLDLPRVLRLWRILRRRFIYHGQTRPEMPADCPERLDPSFLAEVWHWDRKKGLALLDQMKGRTRTLHLTSPGDVRRFLADPEQV